MKKNSFTIIELLVATVILALLIAAFCMFDSIQESRKKCRSVNLLLLRRAMDAYAADHNQQFPTPHNWCDLLLEHGNVDKARFKCPAVRKGRCHYAINPDAEPNSPGDVVLLFETGPGWNQSGGPEILSTNNHFHKGCSIRFVDGHGEWVKPENIAKLKWR